ncbi:glycosyl hydrolase [Lutibacter sp. TH_r2]|uniref:WD40/YVTN/BNR-like repeat-containing protein n=1 Tax=Lutibacter sp. TH_r2 TaxID=3082083 RepID=UPI00295524DB|nr:glycosyl hydrolase [Lutibacter sp. TH_r2]MDV7186765.1 glycosyl hydrolase [Lutibacter sp. TH_r2]
MKKLTILFSLLFISFGINAQESIVKNVPFTNIGPTVMSGRVVDIDVNPEKTTEFYVGYASGGVWYTNNNGASFEPIMDSAETINVGDIAVDWKKGTIWVGTGESNSSRSSYAGIGILKSTDKGKTWTNTGLKDSQHVGRIIINKNNPNEVVVGVVGHLYTPNKERGIFKTTDGGKTWKNVLFINKNTGVIDVSVSPTDSNTLFAATWERDRKAWNFTGDGEGSAIYKSEDAGTTWNKITTKKSGFPTGDGVGRIGLAAYDSNVIYALLDNQNMRPEKKEKSEVGLKKDDFKQFSKEEFLNLNEKDLNEYLEENGFPKKYSAKSVKDLVSEGKIQPIDLANYLEDANYILLNSEVIGAEVYKSEDGGKTWKKTHKDYLDDVYSSYGYYFGIIAVNTSNQNKIYIGGVPLLKSDDGGKSFSSMWQENVHADHQALWVNPNLEGHVLDGNDGGINITYDDGDNWYKNNSPAVGQFYSVNVDNKKPYNVYGGLQDNGVWYGPSTYKASKSWNSSGEYPYKSLGGGDGMQVQIDSRDNNVVYSGSQFGYYYRVNTETGDYLSIHPTHELGDSPYRYNWQAPILLSPHNQDILYMGANKLLRSMDKGETFDVISEDLTTGGKKGNVPYGTLTTIYESPFKFGFMYVGSDDGYINVTENGGNTWTRISDNLPQGLWVSRVIASQFEENTVYATLNGYRNDDFKAYVYVSENKGKTWKSITSNIENSPVNVIKEDSENENVLYVGTDNALYVSLNKGESWELFSNNLPPVAIHDLVIQKEAKDLVVGTHGRSIYKANISGIQQFEKTKGKDVVIFDIPSKRHSSYWGKSWSKWMPLSDPELEIPYFVNKSGIYTLEILAEDGTQLNSFKVEASKGYNYFVYNISTSEKVVENYFMKKKIKVEKAQTEKYYLPKGKYKVKIGEATSNFELK